ncbi:Bug family tripartite tricarboxylate transporter substrate binding protein [Cupriavidus pauculus]|uniref:Bug family tripartite tricarboxylate transporter substrate binding protein n=1 Tax=Cupriavidus pauculus TaxID=82633 RepID=UPI001245F227|nr:tripartite tricarboxylate transporter substrate binding protein [Cupriavidus pauculus]KAB0603774.1 tripartite tricarboxylate transporter substrate binding protein [Cupriavidus pauculus]UAL03406.1 tripartite tricarboxylate transporter substrate binding protein [Cupriavidus pauculus]
MKDFLRRAAVGVLLVCAANAHAQQPYPSKPIRVVVAFTAGGTTDILAREVAQQMGKALGQSVVVENRPGAGGNIGTDFVGRSDADGYTLLATSVGPVAINPTLYTRLKVNPQTDLQPVAPIADVPNVLVVNPNLPATTVQELVAYARAHPNQLNFSSTGVGTAAHLSGVLFNERTGVKTTHVPYKGADALNDLLAGRVQFMFATVPSVISHIRGGQLRALAVTSRKRSVALPDVPTMAEAGVPKLVTGAWFGLFAPKGTPPEIVAKLNQTVTQALAQPDMRNKLAQQGAEAMSLAPDAFGKFVVAEYQAWKPVVISSGARID